jgi:hypothetical protein
MKWPEVDCKATLVPTAFAFSKEIAVSVHTLFALVAPWLLFDVFIFEKRF